MNKKTVKCGTQRSPSTTSSIHDFHLTGLV
jgi:hypothetical protein